MRKLTEIGKWYSIEQIAELQKEVEAQDTLIEQAQEYIEDVELDALDEQIRALKHEMDSLGDEAFSIPADAEYLAENGWDLVRFYAGPDEKSVRGQPSPHLEYGNSKSKIWVRSFKSDSKPFESVPIEERLEDAPV